MTTKRTLVVEIDVTGWTDEQIMALDSHITAQFEAFDADADDGDGSYPDAENATSRIVEQTSTAGRFGAKRKVTSTYLSGAPTESVTRDPEVR